MTGTRAVITVLAILLLCTGCQTLAPFFEKPQIEFEKMRLARASMFQSTLAFTFKVYNPNPLGAGIAGLSYRLTVAGHQMASEERETDIRVAPAGNQTVSLTVTLCYKDFVAADPTLINRAVIPCRLSGHFDILGYRLPFEAGGEIANHAHRLFRGQSLFYCCRGVDCAMRPPVSDAVAASGGRAGLADKTDVHKKIQKRDGSSF